MYVAQSAILLVSMYVCIIIIIIMNQLSVRIITYRFSWEGLEITLPGILLDLVELVLEAVDHLESIIDLHGAACLLGLSRRDENSSQYLQNQSVSNTKKVLPCLWILWQDTVIDGAVNKNKNKINKSESHKLVRSLTYKHISKYIILRYTCTCTCINTKKIDGYQ